jgi:5'-3' exonuclease
MQTLFENEENQHIVVLDGHNLIFRTVFIAHAENKKQKTEDPGYIYWKHVFLSELKFMVEKHKPTRFIIVFDSKLGSWRKNIYPEYKANRKIARELSKVDFKEFFKVSNPFLKDLKDVFCNLEILEFDGIEGDDIIAVLCQNFKEKITIISTDKDFHQLQVFKNVKQYEPKKKQMVNVLNPKISLEQKIIGGDENDNIPAIVPRCGKVKVANIMSSDLISNIYDEEYLKEEENVKAIVKKYKINPEEIKKNLQRNTELIDLKFIPKDISEKILKTLREPNTKKFDGRKFMSFLVEHRMGNLVEKMQDYNETLGKLFWKGC